MATTYTENLHLGMQLDKTDYFSMDLINENWQKIDAAVSGESRTYTAAAMPATRGINLNNVGIAEYQEV